MTTADRKATLPDSETSERLDEAGARAKIVALAGRGRAISPPHLLTPWEPEAAIRLSGAKLPALIPPGPALAVALPLIYASLTVVFLIWLAVFSVLFAATMAVDLVRRSVRRMWPPSAALEYPAVR
jgi:hypothetical protein